MSCVVPALSMLVSLIVPASVLAWPATDRLSALEELSEEVSP